MRSGSRRPGLDLPQPKFHANATYSRLISGGPTRSEAMGMERKTLPSWPQGLSAAVAVLAAVIILSVGGWQIHRTREAILHDAEQQLQSLCRSLAQHAARTIEAVDMALVVAVDRAEDPHANPGPADYLKRWAAMLGQVHKMLQTNADGLWIDDSISPHGPVSSADRVYFQWHQTHPDRALHVDQPIVERLNGKVGIPLSRRINAPDGSFAGVAVAMLAPEYLEQFYRSLNISSHSAISLWMDDGRLLLRFPAVPSETKTDPSVPQASVAERLKSRSGINRSQSPWDGVDRLFAFEHIDDLPLIVATGVSVDDVLSDWRRDAIVQAIVLGGAALALVILGVGVEVYRRRMQVFSAASRETDRQYRLSCREFPRSDYFEAKLRCRSCLCLALFTRRGRVGPGRDDRNPHERLRSSRRSRPRRGRVPIPHVGGRRADEPAQGLSQRRALHLDRGCVSLDDGWQRTGVGSGYHRTSGCRTGSCGQRGPLSILGRCLSRHDPIARSFGAAPVCLTSCPGNLWSRAGRHAWDPSTRLHPRR